jgi:hypothetical protein
MPIPLSAKQDGGNLGRNLLDPNAPTNPVPADLFRGQSGDRPSTTLAWAAGGRRTGLQDLLRVGDAVAAALVRTCGLTSNFCLSRTPQLPLKC